MIDTSVEQAISLKEATNLRELQKDGRKPHIGTVWRWTTTGCNGIRLEYTKIGNSRCTSREAVVRFLERLSRRGVPAEVPTPSQYRERINAARERLAAAGI